MKKLISIFMAISFVIAVFAGCNGGSAPSGSAASSGAGGESKTENANAPETAPVIIQIGYENNPGEPIDQAANEWKRLLEEKSGGNMTAELFPSSQLGSKTDIIDQMVAGDNVMTLADGAFYADRGVPDMGIVFGPYLFDNWEQCWKLVESDWWDSQCELLTQQGIQMVTANWIYGTRHTLTNKPVNTVADLKGMKIRVPNNTIQIKGFEVLGASPTPMALGEVYTSLQQGTIDGLENPLTVLYNGSYHEVAKNLILDGHVMNYTTWICGTGFYNSLTAEQQQWLVESGKEAGVYNNDLVAELDAETIQKFKDAGVNVVEPTDEAMQGFKDAAKAFYELPDFTSIWSDGLYDTIQEIINS